MILEFKREHYDGVLNLWNKELDYEAISEDRFNELILADVNYDNTLSLVAVEDEQVVGYVLATKRKYPYLDRGLEPERGFINVIVVDRHYQHQGIGTMLLKEIEKRLKARGVSRITVGAYSPSYFFVGVEKTLQKHALDFFVKHNYDVLSDAVSMEMSLGNYRYPEKINVKKQSLEQQGFEFRSFVSEDTPELLEFLNREFGAGWKSNATELIRSQQGSRFIQVCVDVNQTIVGVTMRAIDKNPGRFGPFGVAEAFRNYGLGSVLFHETMKNMKQEKTLYTYFLWSGGAAQRFYERQGMTVYRDYKLVEKRI